MPTLLICCCGSLHIGLGIPDLRSDLGRCSRVSRKNPSANPLFFTVFSSVFLPFFGGFFRDPGFRAFGGRSNALAGGIVAPAHGVSATVKGNDDAAHKRDAQDWIWAGRGGVRKGRASVRV